MNLLFLICRYNSPKVQAIFCESASLWITWNIIFAGSSKQKPYLSFEHMYAILIRSNVLGGSFKQKLYLWINLCTKFFSISNKVGKMRSFNMSFVAGKSGGGGGEWTDGNPQTKIQADAITFDGVVNWSPQVTWRPVNVLAIRVFSISTTHSIEILQKMIHGNYLIKADTFQFSADINARRADTEDACFLEAVLGIHRPDSHSGGQRRRNHDGDDI